MKKILTFTWLLLAGAFTATAQDDAQPEAKILLGGRLGLTSSMLTFGGEAGPDASKALTTKSDLGLSLGVPVLIRLSKSFSLETGLGYYSLLPSMEETASSGSFSQTATEKYQGGFLALPLLLNLGLEKPKVRVGLSAGLMGNLLVGGKQESSVTTSFGSSSSTSTDNGTLEQYDALDLDEKNLRKLNKLTFSANLGAYIGFKMARGGIVQVDGRYNLALAPLYEYNPTNGRNLTTSVNSFVFSVAYLHPVSFQK